MKTIKQLNQLILDYIFTLDYEILEKELNQLSLDYIFTLDSEIPEPPHIDRGSRFEIEDLTFKKELEDHGYHEISLIHIFNEYWTIEGLSLRINIRADQDQDTMSIQDDLLENEYQLVPLLRDLLFSIYSDTTNNDACSYRFEFDTDHATMPGEEGTWALTVTITDYLS
jgi:hypothetical protein